MFDDLKLNSRQMGFNGKRSMLWFCSTCIFVLMKELFLFMKDSFLSAICQNMNESQTDRIQIKLRWKKVDQTSPHILQMLPQNLSCSAVRNQAQESFSVQATQLTPLELSQFWIQTVKTKLSLTPVQPVIHLPFRPQSRIWTNQKKTITATKKSSRFPPYNYECTFCVWMMWYHVGNYGCFSPEQIQQNWPSPLGWKPLYWWE